MRARAPMQGNVTLLCRVLLCFREAVRICYTLMHCRRHEFPFPWPGCVVCVCSQGYLPRCSDQRCLYLSAPVLGVTLLFNLLDAVRYAHTEVWRKRTSCIGEKEMVVALCRSECEFKLAYNPGGCRELWACKTVAVLTLHVSVAISGASKLCIKKLLKARNFIWARRKNSLAPGHASSAPTPRRVCR